MKSKVAIILAALISLSALPAKADAILTIFSMGYYIQKSYQSGKQVMGSRCIDAVVDRGVYIVAPVCPLLYIMDVNNNWVLSQDSKELLAEQGLTLEEAAIVEAAGLNKLAVE